MSKSAPFGAWESPITAEAITGSAPRLANVLVDESQSKIYHIEARPYEKGRNVLVDTSSGDEILDKDVNVRTGVHEYGGGAIIASNGTIYYSNFANGRVYRKHSGEVSAPITPESSVYRYADFNVYPTNSRFITAVLEDHTVDEPSKVVNTICIIDADNQKVLPLISGTDFYAAPRFSPDGKYIAWQQWSAADMPWEGGELHIAEVSSVDKGFSIQNDKLIAGKSSKISAGYPYWSSNDKVIFTHDSTGYQNLYVYALNDAGIKPLSDESMKADFAEPAWSLGESPFAQLDAEGRYLLAKAIQDGGHRLFLIDLNHAGHCYPIDTPYVRIDDIRTASAKEHKAVFRGASADAGFTVVECTVAFPSGPSEKPRVTFKTLKSLAKDMGFPSGIISFPRPMSLDIDGKQIHVIYYPPHNPAYAGSDIDGEKPPCVVNCHGGPTGFAYQDLNWNIQYFTTRGFGWLEVNYGGSYGYGREYIQRLDGNWGVVDISDVASAAKSLSSAPHSLVDPKRMFVRGPSAGGYTTLAAITLPSDVTVFAGATSLFGISDLRGLSDFSHKFENTYMDKLLGGSFAENPKVYADRSPLSHADRIAVPLLILQGDIDKVVPKEQAQLIYDSIQKRNGVVDMVVYEGEGHGWRRDDTMKDALERELSFYKKTLKLE